MNQAWVLDNLLPKLKQFAITINFVVVPLLFATPKIKIVWSEGVCVCVSEKHTIWSTYLYKSCTYTMSW